MTRRQYEFDLTGPWYRNAGCVAPLIFFAILAVGIGLLMFFNALAWRS